MHIRTVSPSHISLDRRAQTGRISNHMRNDRLMVDAREQMSKWTFRINGNVVAAVCFRKQWESCHLCIIWMVCVGGKQK